MQDFIKQIAIDAGKISLEYRHRINELKVHSKETSSKDLVTEADRAIETYLRKQIEQKYPDHAILGEEFGDKAGKQYRWIIDPIDGTTSFVHQQPFYSISIALYKDDQPYLAAVYAPVLDELFTAEAQGSAKLNGRKITVSKCSQLDQAMLATGFACLRANLTENNLPYFNALAPKIRGIRRFGSAAVDLCYVACGRLDGFWELNLKIYDVAAGMLILQEAGGKITDFADKTEKIPNQVLATNGPLHPQIQQIIQNTRPTIYTEND